VEKIHRQQHLPNSAFITDVIIGLPDGLAIPFVLAAGLSGAVTATASIITVCSIAIVIGAVTMGLGGYLTGKTELTKRAFPSALNIALFYVVGGTITLAAYILISDPVNALKASAVITLSSLFIVGFVKSKLVNTNPWAGAIRITIITALAAGSAFGVVRLIF
jgi:VIT1/CCC1 family predicted Fe2+/Mn2+ transporter